MGYYSNHAISYFFEGCASHQTPAERILHWLIRRWNLLERIDELEQRQEDLYADELYKMGYCPDATHGSEERVFTAGLFWDETRYVAPEDLDTMGDVRKAIRLAEFEIEAMDRMEMEARAKEKEYRNIRRFPEQTTLDLDWLGMKLEQYLA